MEIRRNGWSVILTCKEFKTLAYLIKNPWESDLTGRTTQ
jgi:hypothetical protein